MSSVVIVVDDVPTLLTSTTKDSMPSGAGREEDKRWFK
jgi:hypothetical protein